MLPLGTPVEPDVYIITAVSLRVGLVTGVFTENKLQNVNVGKQALVL